MLHNKVIPKARQETPRAHTLQPGYRAWEEILFQTNIIAGWIEWAVFLKAHSKCAHVHLPGVQCKMLSRRWEENAPVEDTWKDNSVRFLSQAKWAVVITPHAEAKDLAGVMPVWASSVSWSVTESSLTGSR